MVRFIKLISALDRSWRFEVSARPKSIAFAESRATIESSFHSVRACFYASVARVIMADRQSASLRFQRRGEASDSGAVGTLPEPLSSDTPPNGCEPCPDNEMTESELGEASRPAADLDAFAVQIHQSLQPRDVITVAVHELRQLLRCERVCYLERRGKRYRLVAASGQSGVPPRSRVALMLEQFVTAILPRGERFLFPDDRDLVTLPDDLSRRLANYWEVANGQLILVEPLFGTLPDSVNSSSRRVVGELVIEQFSRSSLPHGAIGRLDSAVRHLTAESRRPIAP